MSWVVLATYSFTVTRVTLIACVNLFIAAFQLSVYYNHIHWARDSWVQMFSYGALGFVSCFGGINVALTRERTGLIVVGNGNFYYRIFDDMCSLFDEYIARKCIVGPLIDKHYSFVETTSIARPALSSLGSMKQSLSSTLLRTVGGTMTASLLEGMQKKY